MAQNVIAVEGIAWLPLMKMYFVNGSRSYGQKLNSNGDFIYGGRVSYIHYTSTRFGFGVEGGFESTQHAQNASSYESYNDDYLARVYEPFQIQTYSLLAKIEWKKNNSKLPIGFSHQIGIGVTANNVLDKDYSYEHYLRFGGKIEYTPDKPVRTFDSSHRLFAGIILAYTLNAKIKLGENLAVNIGGRYQFNYLISSFTGLEYTKNYDFSKSELRQIVGYSQYLAPFRLSIGIAYMF